MVSHFLKYNLKRNKRIYITVLEATQFGSEINLIRFRNKLYVSSLEVRSAGLETR